jgi:LysM repeat protein
MNKFTVITLSTAVVLGAIFPAIAQTEKPITAEQVLIGKVTSIEKPEVTVQFPENQEQTYHLDEALVKSMNLSQGSTVTIDHDKLGTIISVDRDSVVVEFADGKTAPYFLHQEGRGTLNTGDRIVVTPDRRLERAKNYVLTAADVQMPIAMIVTTPVNSGTVNQSIPNNIPTTTPATPTMPSSMP